MTVHIAPFQPENLDSIFELEKKSISKDTAFDSILSYRIDTVAYCLKNGKTIIGYIILKLKKSKVGWILFHLFKKVG